MIKMYLLWKSIYFPFHSKSPDYFLPYNTPIHQIPAEWNVK